MHAKFSSVFAVVLAVCAGVQGAASPATRPDISRPSIPTGHCVPTVVLATTTSTRYLTQYTTATADQGVTKKRRGDDHPHALAARQAVTTTVTSTSTRNIAMSTSTVTTTLTRTTTARASSTATVTSTVTGRPVGRTETVTSTITNTAISTAATPTTTTTVTVTTYQPL